METWVTVWCRRDVRRLRLDLSFDGNDVDRRPAWRRLLRALSTLVVAIAVQDLLTAMKRLAWFYRHRS
jgi:hypothetical protein